MYASRDDPGLHSFPTRRSSDLAATQGRRACVGPETIAAAGLHKTRGDRLWTDARDRKSTRLNSSHPSISYAVFCLQKKKTELFPAHPPCSPTFPPMSLRSPPST